MPLFIVSTPIGNLGDMSARGIETMQACSLILAEDTRKTRVLLDHFNIRAPLTSLREHNEASVTPKVIQRLSKGENIALVSDAGTPLVSDPGDRLVRAAIDAGIVVTPIPGASALLAALVGTGFEPGPFTFFGFVPRKTGERTELADTLGALPHTAICYESPERLAETLAAWAEAGLGDRKAVIARELTKRFEEFRRGTVRELAAYYRENPVRGEIVVLLAGATPEAPDEVSLEALARTLRSEGLPARDVARRLSEQGAPRNLAYRLAHE